MTRLRLARWVVRILSPQCAVVPREASLMMRYASTVEPLAWADWDAKAPCEKAAIRWTAMVDAAEGES